MSDRTPRVRWHGHATVSITDGGTTILTDPILTDRVAHLRRRRGPNPLHTSGQVTNPLRPDAVVLSHLHADHTHLPSLRLIGGDVPILVPAGAVGQMSGLRAFGDRLIEVSPGDEVRIGGVLVRGVPAEHDGRRWPRGPHRVRALGYVIEGEGRTYFAGDTALFGSMSDWIPECDVALIPVGGWGPSLGPGHLDPAAAVRAAVAVGARTAIPVHFGTLWPMGFDSVRPERFYGPGAEFVRRMAEAGLSATELRPGESS
ncbi:MBL fold metallo-hydrolase [Rhodococcus maanshanensis]|uniref:L-ascorbate metabolism protein UlaG, beta-lactamase superfamily n=1 Tax=Rhodococcus maanshanensis TaxID=183556 RepID=A0A1H7LKY7_9NOCA|nr:MBL fold metallo-hydrolase [Rhodococcus maanshanensis]SEK99556.1 L-ascorbate metabolism protein UlaG, beta-lactamase superfamily [Rhodococcus maanshanensis]